MIHIATFLKFFQHFSNEIFEGVGGNFREQEGEFQSDCFGFSTVESLVTQQGVLHVRPAPAEPRARRARRRLCASVVAALLVKLRYWRGRPRSMFAGNASGLR
jgi:hypothetical protein